MWELYWIYYILGIVMIPGIVIGIWAQIRVTTTFNEYNKIETKHGVSASKVARFMLDAGGCYDTKVNQVAGELTDHFNPKTNTVSLSQSVHDQSTIAAVGVTAHEIGHVFQHREKYAPMRVRNFLVPVINFTSFLVWPMLFIGIILEFTYWLTAANVLIYIAIGLYALNTIFCLITLPIELNASKRAEKMLLSTGELDEEEIKGVKKVLNAAAYTYVAALVTSILSLLRLILSIAMIRKD